MKAGWDKQLHLPAVPDHSRGVDDCKRKYLNYMYKKNVVQPVLRCHDPSFFSFLCLPCKDGNIHRL